MARQPSLTWRRPNLCGGSVCVRGTGVAVWVLRSRYRAGESFRALAADYDLPVATVRAVMRLKFGGRPATRGSR